jgi:acetyl-CoA acetyltransferase
MTLKIGIAGWSLLPPRPEIPGALDELIYLSTSAALQTAGMTIREIDGVSMASSDLNDGRAISTMTLTGSTGSFHKSELRVCNDGLAAVWTGAAEVGSGAASTLMVCAWSKLSDVVDPAAIPALAMEPTLHRALGYHPDAVLRLRESYETKAIVATTGMPKLEPLDTAAAIIITKPDHPNAGKYLLSGFGASTGAYLRPGEPVLMPAAAAAAAALKSAGLTAKDVVRVYIGGLHRISDGQISGALGIPVEAIARESVRAADLGYAAGLVALINALNRSIEGPTLVVSAAGLGMESANAVVLEKK